MVIAAQTPILIGKRECESGDAASADPHAPRRPEGWFRNGTVLKTIAAAALAAVLLVSSPLRADAPVPAGWVEYAAVFPGGLIFSAKLDSGARNSSIYATRIETFRRSMRDWVRFRLKADDGTTQDYELPVVRLSRTRDMTGPALVRPVVRLRLCVGDSTAEVEVNLSDRKNFNHRLLIGRSFLRKRFLVDTSERLLHKLGCAGLARK